MELIVSLGKANGNEIWVNRVELTQNLFKIWNSNRLKFLDKKN